MAAVLWLVAVPAMFAGPVDAAGFYNAGGWGPAILANSPPLIWFLVVGTVLLRLARADRSRFALVSGSEEPR